MKLFTALTRIRASKRRASQRLLKAGQSDRSKQIEKLEDRLLLTAITFNAPSTNNGDGTWSQQSRDGETVAVGPAYLYYNLNPFASFPGYSQGDALHLKVDYYDEGTGSIRVQYDSTRENFDLTDFHTRSTRVDSQQFVTSYHYLDSTQFSNGTNGNDFRVGAWGAPVASVTISNEPFADSGLEWAWAPPWESGYIGASRPVDASTLQGKVLTGYQGWFNTPNDAADEGYVHWGSPGDWSIEQWPDPNDYDSSELFAVPGVTTARGEQAYLFSSANGSVIDRHFQWMREHDIDGVLLQRFRESFMKKATDGTYSGEPQWPVVNARDAAHRSGRTWAIEYDIQNGSSPAVRDQIIQEVKDDWEYLTDPAGLDMLNDTHYQQENGKPVVTIFGLYVSPSNGYSTAQQQDLISYFQSRGIYVVGAGRHAEAQAQIANAGLHDAYIPWQGYWKGGDSYSPDEIRLNGVTNHIPHVFPGFSWTHLQNSSSATSRDREDGEFYWRMLDDAANETDAPWWFIGMFDEYDEGTNLIPGTDDPPVPDNDAGGNPLTYQVSDPRPNDWWMALTGAAKQALQNKSAINATIPSESSLQNRSNTGGEARWEVGSQDRLASLETSDSSVEMVDVPVQGEVSTAIRSTDPYLYFAVDDGFMSAEADGRDVTVEVEYLDLAVGQFNLEYDGVGAAFTATPNAVLTGSGQWRTHRFELTDAYFNNRQTDGADLRLTTPGGNLFVRRVSVIKESMLTVEADLGPTDTANGLQHVEQSGDGQSVSLIQQGRQARVLTGSPSSLYLYVDVDAQFAHEVHAGLNTIVEVTYQDVGAGQLNIQYDSTDAAYKNATPVPMNDSGEWRTARFYLDDAFFGDRQNGGTDFRITGSNIPIDRVRVLTSFSDLADPELTVGQPAVEPQSSTVTVSWSMTDDWRSGHSDQWTVPEDSRVFVETSNDDGLTWQAVASVEQNAGDISSNSYDALAGVHNWSDEFAVDTEEFVSGAYRLRLVPIDGHGNAGTPVVTEQFTVYAPPELPGDYNTDGVVNAADYSMWRDSLGASVQPYSQADGDGSGVVDAGDNVVWRTNYGRVVLTTVVESESSDAVADIVAADVTSVPRDVATRLAEEVSQTPVLRRLATDSALATDAAFAALTQPIVESPVHRQRFHPVVRTTATGDNALLLQTAQPQAISQDNTSDAGSTELDEKSEREEASRGRSSQWLDTVRLGLTFDD